MLTCRSGRGRLPAYLSVAALFALLIPLLVACGGDAGSPTQAPAAATAPVAGATAPATTAPAGQATTAPTRAPSPAAAVSPASTGSPAAGTAAGGDDFPKGGKSSTLEPVGRKGGRIIEVSTSDAQTLNPMLNTDTASGAIIGMLFNNLVALNPDTGLPFANLAAEVPTLENGGIS